MLAKHQAQRVLIVEEDRVEAGIVAFHLRRAGYKPLLVSSSDEAADAVAWGTPDAVVAELGGAGINGLQLASSLAGSSLLFVLVADRPLTGEEQLEVLRLRLHQVVQKPVDPDILVDRLQRSTPHVLGPPAGADPAGIHGSLGDHSVVDLIRMAARHHIDCHLAVTDAGPDGWLVMRQGQIIDAALGTDKIAKDAAIDLLLLEEGAFCLRPLAADAPDLLRGDSVRCDLAQLVSEAMGRATPVAPAAPRPQQQASAATRDTQRSHALARQVGIPNASPPVTLPGAANPRPKPAPPAPPAPAEVTGFPEVPPTAATGGFAAPPSGASPRGNLPWWKPPPLKGFQPPRQAGARRRGNRLKLDTRPRVRDGEVEVGSTPADHSQGQPPPDPHPGPQNTALPKITTASKAPAEPAAPSPRAKRSAAGAGAYVRKPASPAPAPAEPSSGPRIKASTAPRGFNVSDATAPAAAADDDPRKRITTKPGMIATDPSEELAAELQTRSPYVPEMVIPGRRSAGPRISKGSPQVLAGSPRARLKPPPFRRPSPTRPPPQAGTAQPPHATAQEGPPTRLVTEPISGAPRSASPMRSNRGRARRFQTAGRMKAVQPNADLAAAYEEFKDEHGIRADSAGQDTAPPAELAPPQPPAQAPESPSVPTPAAAIAPEAAQSPRATEPVTVAEPAPQRPEVADERGQAPEVASMPTSPAPAAVVVPTPPTAPEAVPTPPTAAEAAPTSSTAPEAVPTSPTDLQAVPPPPPTAPEAVPTPPTAPEAATTGATEADALAAAEAERVVGRLVPRTFFKDGERPKRRLRGMSQPDLPVFSEDMVATREVAGLSSEALAAMTAAAPQPSALPRGTPQSQQTDPPFPGLPAPPDSRASSMAPPADNVRRAGSSDAGMALTGLTAALPSEAPRSANLKPVIYALVAIFVGALGFVGYQLATKPAAVAPRPGAPAVTKNAGPTFGERLGDATLALENEKYPVAAKLFGALLKERKDNLPALSGRAKALFVLERWKEAEPAFEALRDAAPDEANVYWHLVYVYIANGKDAEAKVVADKFRALSPADSAEAKEIQAAVEKR